jgi:protein-S-isoprenylcysteine O-methyltransferase Ste14
MSTTNEVIESPPGGFWGSARQFDLRGWLAPWLVLATVFMPQGSTAVVVTGLVLIGLFVALRLWAARHIGGAARVHQKSARKVRQLIVAGPFAWCRNPLYVANALGAAGAGMAFGPAWAGALILVIMLVWYTGVARWEEGNLTALYPSEYPAYKASTPLLLPRPPKVKPPEPEGGVHPWRKVLKRERTMFLGVVVVAGGSLWSLLG